MEGMTQSNTALREGNSKSGQGDPVFSQEPNRKGADGPSDSLCGGLKGKQSALSRGLGDPGVGGGGNSDSFLGEKPLGIGRAAEGRFPEMGGGRKKEIGSR